ncbi:MAG: hypothetical protein AAB074_05400 [Planctomycetota bacterium]
MRFRSTLNAAVFALLAVATFVAGTAGPLHEIEALHGHEHCESEDGQPTVGHVCHDEDDCTVCGLLSLPSSAEPCSSPAIASEAPATAGFVLLERAVAATLDLNSPARAPPPRA